MGKFKVEKIPVSLCYLGEGPTWNAEKQELLYLDIFANTIFRYVPATGESFRVTVENVESLSVVVPIHAEKDKYLITTGKSIQVMEWNGISTKPKSLRVIHTVEDHLTRNRFNDGKCDPQGRLWVGTMGYEPMPGIENLDRHKGTLYKLDLNGAISNHVDGIDIANGIAWSADCSIMYYIDTFTYRVDAFDFNAASGTLSNRRPVFDFKVKGIVGVPDGMTIDSDDNLWVAVFSGKRVLKIDPRKGTLLDWVEFPTDNITSVAFGGPNLDVLYCTSAQHGIAMDDYLKQPTAGALFRVTNTGAKGQGPGYNFKGKL